MDDQNKQIPEASGLPEESAPDFWRSSGEDPFWTQQVQWDNSGSFANREPAVHNTQNGQAEDGRNDSWNGQPEASGTPDSQIWQNGQNGAAQAWNNTNARNSAAQGWSSANAQDPAAQGWSNTNAQNGAAQGWSNANTQNRAAQNWNYQPAQNSAVQKSGGLAIACLVLGILGFFSGIFLIGLILDVVAVILGIVALTNGYPKKGTAIGGLVIAILSIVTTVLVYAAASGGFSSIKDPFSVDDPYRPSQEELMESAALMEQVSYTDYATPSGIILIFENQNQEELDFTVNVSYYDEDGELLSIRDGYFWACAASGGEAALLISAPHNRDYDIIPYNHYSVEVFARDSNYYSAEPVTTNYSKDIKVTASRSSNDGILVSIISNAPVPITDMELACVFYRDGKPVGFSTSYLNDYMEGQTEEFYPPYDEEYNDIEYDDFRVFVNNAESRRER